MEEEEENLIRDESKTKLNKQVDLVSSQDAEESYKQTHTALNEALSEQNILKEKLRVLERRNKPAKFGKPIIVHSISAFRGKISEDELTPERIIFELNKATNLLENAKRAVETSESELIELEENTEGFKVKAEQELEEMLRKNSTRHKNEMLHMQHGFQHEMQKWNEERSLLLAEAEKYSILSQNAVNKSAILREQVEQQRKKIQKYAAELRSSLAHSKELKDKLDKNRKKIALIPNLYAEIDANEEKTTQLKNEVAEQTAILRAVKVSEQAQKILDDNDSQIKELQEAKKKAQEALYEAQNDKRMSLQLENQAKENIEKAQEKFREAQSRMFVLEADIREMKAEYSKQRQSAIDEGFKNIDLQVKLKEEKIDATQRFIIENCSKIHRVDRVQSTLSRVRSRLQSRPSTPNTPLSSLSSQTSSTVKVSKTPSFQRKGFVTPRRAKPS